MCRSFLSSGIYNTFDREQSPWSNLGLSALHTDTIVMQKTNHSSVQVHFLLSLNLSFQSLPPHHYHSLKRRDHISLTQDNVYIAYWCLQFFFHFQVYSILLFFLLMSFINLFYYILPHESY